MLCASSAVRTSPACQSGPKALLKRMEVQSLLVLRRYLLVVRGFNIEAYDAAKRETRQPDYCNDVLHIRWRTWRADVQSLAHDVSVGAGCNLCHRL